MNISRNKLRKIRHKRVRGKVQGTAKKPRLNVFRSLRYIYAQVINDEENKVIVEANNREISRGKAAKTSLTTVTAEEVGKLIAKRSLDKGISEVVYDRGGYKYHGQVQSLAEAARKAGLQF